MQIQGGKGGYPPESLGNILSFEHSPSNQRGNPTMQLELILNDGYNAAPAGTSTGKSYREASYPEAEGFGKLIQIG